MRAMPLRGLCSRERGPRMLIGPYRIAALAGAILLLASTTAQTQTPAAPTFHHDIAPLVFEHCATCHRPGGAAPFALLTYADTRARARQILSAVSAHTMPPWKAEAPVDAFEGERRLSAAQIELFRRWVDAGALRGEPADQPATPEWRDDWQLGAPDLVVHLTAPYRLAPAGPDRLRNFPVPIPVSETRYVRAWEFRTNNTRAVHHATLMVDTAGAARRLDSEDADSGYEGLIPLSAQSPEGYFLGWTPGQLPYKSNPDLAWRIDPGSDLIVMLHMQPTGAWESVDASVALYFADRAPSKVPVMIRLNRQDLDIPAGATSYVARDSYTLPVDIVLYGIQPHAHYLAREVKGTALLPDGRSRPLIYIRDWDFHWQDVYRFREPLRLPAGTRLTMEFTYDNSAGNRANPSFPARRVRWGQRSTDEMGDLWFQVTAAGETERARLVSDVRKKLVPQHIDGYRKMIEADPHNPSLHDDLALLAIEAGNVEMAVGEFRQAVGLRPETASAHYNLANALLMVRQTPEAVDQFHEALRLDPEYGLAHQGLGLALAAMGRLDEGAEALERATRRMPRSADASYNLGVLRQQQARLDDALAAYEEAARINAAHAEAQYAAGLIHEARGHALNAMQAFRQAVDARPAWSPALSELAWMLAVAPDRSMRRPEEALRLGTDAVRAGGGRDARAADALAAALAAVGRYDEAAAQARLAIALLPPDADRARRDALDDRLALYLRRQPFVLAAVASAR